MGAADAGSALTSTEPRGKTMKLIRASDLFNLGRSMAELEMLVSGMQRLEEAERQYAGYVEYESWRHDAAHGRNEESK